MAVSYNSVLPKSGGLFRGKVIKTVCAGVLLERPCPAARLFLDLPDTVTALPGPQGGWLSIEPVWHSASEWHATHAPRCGWLNLRGDESPRELSDRIGPFLRVCDESALLVVNSELDSPEPLQRVQALLTLMA